MMRLPMMRPSDSWSLECTYFTCILDGQEDGRGKRLLNDMTNREVRELRDAFRRGYEVLSEELGIRKSNRESPVAVPGAQDPA